MSDIHVYVMSDIHDYFKCYNFVIGYDYDVSIE